MQVELIEEIESESDSNNNDVSDLGGNVSVEDIVSETAYVQRRSNSGSTLGSNSRANQYSLRNRLKNLTSLNQKRIDKGFSLIELLIVIVILGIISSISVLNITSSRRAANSASAVQSLRVITSSQASYSTGVGNGEYATSEDLLNGEYIDNSLASATLPTPAKINQQPKSGYLFVFETTSTNASTKTVANYEISARPLLGTGLARAGDKSFFVDSTGVIRVSPSPIAPFADSSSQPLN